MHVPLISRYTHWLHSQWPAGKVEKLPIANDDGSTNVQGLYIVGDLTGVPLLKFSADTGARAVMTIANDPSFVKRETSDAAVVDIAIIGGGVSGYAAAMQAKIQNLSFKLIEATVPFSTIENFPKAKPIYTYPTDLTPAGDLQFHEKSHVKEGLLQDLHEQVAKAGIETTFARVESVKRVGKYLELQAPASNDAPIKAHRVIVAIGRSGNYRKLNIPGEDLSTKVSNRLHDPKAFAKQNVLVVGGGDSALEAAIALAQNDAQVTVSYRKAEFSRPKPENIDQLQALQHQGKLSLMMASSPTQITEDQVTLLDNQKQPQTLANDAVFTLIGREAPLDFFRKSGVNISGEWRTPTWVGFVLFFAFALWIYHWKGDYNIPLGLKETFNNSSLGINPATWIDRITSMATTYFNDTTTLGYTLKISASSRSFYYTLLYAGCVTYFGLKRIRRRKTPYVTRQTLTLTVIQVIPLFILPEIIFPWMGHNGLFDSGFGGWFADTFFGTANYGHGREYWRAYGFILAWPLMAWNWFTDAPMWGWLIVGFIQTFIIIPLMVRRWGKGAYCGWVCSCGALAETLGDTHRHKMPHGPFWNKLNMIGQVFLGFAVVLMVLRIIGWIPAIPGSDAVSNLFKYLAKGDGIPIINYAYLVDLLFAGVIGVGLYFHFSGRVWCRFACPLAALMHIYARFSQFRIIADKKKCISCNVCTTVCHQGIDVMNFANKGKPMEDPQCVRCSACVQSCPTGVLTFGRVDHNNNVITTDKLIASQVQMTELTINGQSK
ncbi:MAG: NAD(P)-binding domain-containing protein [Phycisphaeraceae bacterium]|nr:NAD(P)-binding domain-containing protein [Phycisphaeraceae bacterium]